jgi:predicted RNA-binding Zn-ribbon protein involved in translation (DUF1610 family)
MIEEADCPACNATNAPIAQMSVVAHFSCRCCGMWYYVVDKGNRA